MEGISRLSPPSTQFRFQVESFSWLSTCSLKRFESCEFVACGHKWKLAIYPNGNEEKGGEDHLSMYLVSVDSSDFDDNKEIVASFSLFVFDHIQKFNLLHQSIGCFNAKKPDSGFDNFMSLDIFKDPSKGYLVCDKCTFGAEVYFVESKAKEESSSVKKMNNHVPFTYTWKIEKFSELNEDEENSSETFTVEDCDFKILVYPKGNKAERGKSLSVYLALANPNEFSPDREVFLEYSLRVIDQENKKHTVKDYKKSLSLGVQDWGYDRFLPLSDLKASTGYLVKDTCILEAEFTVCR